LTPAPPFSILHLSNSLCGNVSCKPIGPAPAEPVLKKLILFIFVSVLAVSGVGVIYIYLSLPNMSHLKSQNPKTTALIEQRQREAQRSGKEFRVRQIWVGFDGIPILLKEAVRVAEDARFYEHEGIDYEEMNAAVKKNLEQGRWARGASTITQQLAKNLYLSTEKSLIRKLKEYFLALRLEEELSKNRIFHLYLNVIEFGPGVFGVEAAARHYFGKSVGQLSLEEIVRLTAVIPKPLVESPTRNSRWLKWRAGWLLSTLRKTGHISYDQYQQVAGRFQ
jgi:monofunctional biosynthetic peptidoglycan transglycosylase